MACNIVEGQALNCNDGASGIKKAWITEFASVTASTETSGTITALTQAASTKFWLIDLQPENGMLVETLSGNLNTSYKSEQVLTYTVNKPSAKLRNWVKVAAQNRVILIVETANSTTSVPEYKMVGLTRGAFLESSATTSGKAQGEFSGNTLTFKANEPQDCLYLSSSTFTGLSFGA